MANERAGACEHINRRSRSIPGDRLFENRKRSDPRWRVRGRGQASAASSRDHRQVAPGWHCDLDADRRQARNCSQHWIFV